MNQPAPIPGGPPRWNDRGRNARRNVFYRLTRPVAAVWKAAVFFLKVFPMIPSRPIDWVTRSPVIEHLRYPTRTGFAEGEIYRPPGKGPFPGILVCLGVVPFEVNHPQVPVLGKALARAGIAALLYWSPAMRDFRLEPDDIENIALAYDWFIRQPVIDETRSGLLGTCVGGAFALMAASRPLIHDRVAFLSAYAPFSSMPVFARDIASASIDGGKHPWKVDPLTRKVFVHSLTEQLDPGEAERLRAAFVTPGGQDDGGGLSADGQAVYALLTAPNAEAAAAALRRLPSAVQERLAALSPLDMLDDIHTPHIILLHDAGDQVIPVGESRRLVAAFAGRAGVRYTEMHFSHLDPLKGRLPLANLIRELSKFFAAVFPIFRQTA